MTDRLRISAAAHSEPNRTALVTDSGAETFAELCSSVERRIDAWAAYVDVSASPCVAVVGRTDREALVSVLAALEISARLVLVHDRIPDAQRAAQLDTTDAEILVDGATVDVLDHDGPAVPAACAAMVFTSGSSGTPKGVVATRAGLLASADASAANLGWLEHDRWWLGLPLAHVGGLSIVTRCLSGRRAVVLSSRSPWPAISDHAVTLASLVPTQLSRLLDDGPLSFDESDLRAVLVGGAAADPERVAAARRRGLPVLLTWGMSEAGSQIATQSPDVALSTAAADLKTVGTPLPGWRLRVVDGVAEVAGPPVMYGYHPRDTHPSPVTDGWLRTGDHVEWLDGRLRVLGRGADMLISGGENVSLPDVRRRLLRHPDVADVALVPLDDERWGQVIGAVVAWRVGADANATGEAAFRRWCRSELAPWQRPARVRFVAALPTLPNGKVDRRAIADSLR